MGDSSVKLGDVFYLPKFDGGTRHYWIVVTEADDSGQVTMVNVTSWKPGVDETVVVNRGEHRRIGHKSVIFYLDARLAPAETISKAVQAGVCEKCEPCSRPLLDRVQKGILDSSFTPRKIKEFCRAVWRVEEED